MERDFDTELETKDDLIRALIELEDNLVLEKGKYIGRRKLIDKKSIKLIKKMDNQVVDALCDLCLPRSGFDLSNVYEKRALLDKYRSLYKRVDEKFKEIQKTIRENEETPAELEEGQ